LGLTLCTSGCIGTPRRGAGQGDCPLGDAALAATSMGAHGSPATSTMLSSPGKAQPGKSDEAQPACLVAQQVEEGWPSGLQQAEKGCRIDVDSVIQRRLDALQQLPVVDLLRHPAR
jgi:hypothetical protein